jgi:alkylhydroperoxidase family enzyme
MLAPEDATGPEADLYESDFVPNIARALSQVPDHVRILQRETATHYVHLRDLQNPGVGRDLDRLQIELVAARVSALNECFY